MENDELAILVDQMTVKGEIYPHVLSAVYETLLCRSTEALMPSIGRIIDQAETQPAAERSVNSSIGPVHVEVPPSPSEHHKALLLRTENAAFLVVLEFGSKPDDMSRLVAQMIAERRGQPFDEAAFQVQEAAERAAQAGVINQINVCRVREPVETLLPKIIADTYLPDAMFEAGRSHRTPDDPKLWNSYGYENHDLDQWMAFFPALRSVMTHYGQDAAFQAEAAAFKERIYPSMEGFPELAAAKTLGWRLAQEDGFLPDQAARTALSTMEAWQAEMGLQPRLEAIQKLHARCLELGMHSYDTEFCHNDLDNGAYASGDHLMLRDQNRSFQATMSFDADGKPTALTVLHGAPDALRYGTKLRPLASFSIDPDGQPHAEMAPGLKVDNIRSWNSFLLDIETAECCLEEDYPPTASPAPR